MIRIASFNANSIRNRLGIILNWMNENYCDVVCIQETKAMDNDFPIQPILDAGLYCAYKGQKSFNGVAIISKYELEDVKIGLGKFPEDDEARIIRARVNNINIVNTYIPMGTDLNSPRFENKLNWLRGMKDYFITDFTPQDNIVWVGDFNVAREAIDVYDPEGFEGHLCFNQKEHKALDFTLDWGFEDMFRKYHSGEPNQFTFWDYRVPNALKRKMGWRLDHIMATKPLAEKCTNCWIDPGPRLLEKPSDHTFIVAEFEI